MDVENGSNKKEMVKFVSGAMVAIVDEIECSIIGLNIVKI